MAKYVIKGVELEFEIFDADNAELFETLNARVVDEVNNSTSETTLSGKIRAQCNAILDFFDDLFGEGIAFKIFGNSCNYKQCLEAYRDFVLSIENEKNEMDSIVNQIQGIYSTENSSNVVTLNRAQRRNKENRG